MNWPTREHARQRDPLDTSHLHLIKALYILAGGDRAKVVAAVKQAELLRLKDVRAPGVNASDKPVTGDTQ